MDYNEYQRNKSITYLIDDFDDLQELINKDIKQGSGPIYVMIQSRPEVYDKDLITGLTKLTQKLFNLGYSPKVSFNIEELDVDDQELENIIDYSVDLQRKGGDAGFNQDLYTEYTLEEVVDAQINAGNFVKLVKNLDASPFEKFIIVQNYVTSRAYRDNEQEPDNARDLIKVLNGQDIVCVGYASLMEHLLGELGIKCISQHCEIIDRKTKEFLGNHVNNIVYLEDEKYNIKGWYYLDSCWDCKDDGQEPFMRYNFSLIPLSDVDKIKRKEIKVSSGFCGALYSKSEQEDLYQGIIDFTHMADRIAYESCLVPEYNEMYEFLDSPDANMQERRAKACQRLREIFKEEGIASNFFKSDKVPIESSLQIMLANLMQEKVDEELLNKSIEGLRLYNKLKTEERLDKAEYLMARATVGNVYRFLDNFEQGKVITPQENDCLILVEEKLRCIRFAKYLDKVINEAKTMGKAVSLNAYQKAIENANIIQGATESFAKVQAKRAIDYSVKLSEKIFEEDAQNCFRKEALRRRVEQENSK